MSRARKAMCRPSGTRLLLLTLPGTAVPGYRLFRPYGTALLRPVNDTAITPPTYIFHPLAFLINPWVEGATNQSHRDGTTDSPARPVPGRVRSKRRVPEGRHSPIEAVP